MYNKSLAFGATLFAAATVSPALAQSDIEAPKPVMSAASQVGGSLYVTYVAAWIQALSEQFPDLSITQEPGGSSQNVILVSTGQTDFGITASSQAYLGYYGQGWADGQQYQNFVGLHPAYPTYMTAVTLSGSGIQSFEDLQGKNLAVGVPGGGSDVISRELMAHMGIEPASFVNASWEDTGGLIRDGLADAVLYIAGHPAGFLQELEVSQELSFLELSDEQIASFLEAHPYYAPVSLAAGTYEALDSEFKTVGQMNFMIGSPDLPDDFVTALLDGVYERTDALARTHPDFAQTILENVRGIPIPLHPAARRYHQEKGVEIREAAPPSVD
jgi:TRAP transporter TAXI family solute receptor